MTGMASAPSGPGPFLAPRQWRGGLAFPPPFTAGRLEGWKVAGFFGSIRLAAWSVFGGRRSAGQQPQRTASRNGALMVCTYNRFDFLDLGASEMR